MPTDMGPVSPKNPEPGDPGTEVDLSERLRLDTLVERVGMEAAREWARWAAKVYRGSVKERTHYASQGDKKPLFEQSIAQLESFADRGLIS